VLAFLAGWFATSSTASVWGLVISEIYYNTPAVDEALEFIEVTANFSGPEDLSGFAFVEGIRFTFPPGTVLRGGDSIVICADVDAVKTHYGIENAVGNYDGRLDGSGERVTLVDHVGIVVQTLRYNDRGKWPVVPDGTGHSLVLRASHLDSGEPESWTTSPELGGHPGTFAPPGEEPPMVEPPTVLVPRDAEWRFAKGTGPFSDPPSAWREADFDHSSWPVGAAPFGFGEEGLGTVLDDMQSGYTSVVLRRAFEVSSEEIEASIRWLLDVEFDDGFCAYLNGEPFAAANCPTDVVWDGRATGTGEIGNPEQFTLPGELLRVGQNVVAVIGFNSSRRGSDFALVPRVLRQPGPFPETLVIERGDAWRYAKGTGPFSMLPDAWRELEFDDSSWALGRSSFGVGGRGELTILDDMIGNYSSVALRRRFQLSEAEVAATEDFFLEVVYTGGFCAFVNGEAVAAGNCPQPATWNGQATANAAEESSTDGDVFFIPRSLLLPGENILALVGYNRLVQDPGFHLLPQLVHRPFPREEVPEPFAVSFNELFRAADPAESWVEFYNGGGSPVDFSGTWLTDDPDAETLYRFADGTTLPPGEFLAVDAATAGLDFSSEAVRLFLLDGAGRGLAAAVFDRVPPEESPAGTFSEARFPDGSAFEWLSRTPTRGAPNEVERVEDFVLNEIFYHPPEERAGEFLELYHRGLEPLDISGFRFTRGIDFLFPEGSVVAPGEYVVVAEDPALLKEHYGLTGVFGPYEGGLSNQGENVRLVDRLGNRVDEVRYFDSGRWSGFADGGGSSLELIDPTQDNSIAAAWAPSDEEGKADWEEHRFVIDWEFSQNGTFHLQLAARGACRVDDVSLLPVEGGENGLPAPGFEEEDLPWLNLGTHVGSRRVTSDRRSGEACLEIQADGRGNVRCNGVQVEPLRLFDPGVHEVSLWTRWLRGSTLLYVRSQFTPGPFPSTVTVASNLSGNVLARALRLTAPRNLGTPGAENSVRSQLREATGGDNLGPVIDTVRHTPISPFPGESPRVSVELSDSDGIRVVRAFVRDEREGTGDFIQVELEPEVNDGAAKSSETDGLFYVGDLPSFVAVTTVAYYVEAEDGFGNTSRFPAEAPERVLLFPVLGPTEQRAHLLLSRASQEELESRLLGSNALVDATVNFDDVAFHNVGFRYRGSPWGRTVREGYRLRFGTDQALIPGRKTLNLGMRDRPDDAPGYYLEGRAADEAHPLLVPEYRFVSTRVNQRILIGQTGGVPGVAALFDPIDRNTVERIHGSEAAAEAVLLKGNGRFDLQDCFFSGNFEGADVQDKGRNPENYRFYWDHAVHQNRDAWDPFFDLTSVLNPEKTTEEELALRAGEFIDFEAFARGLGTRMLLAGSDALLVHTGHNGYLFHNPRTQLWEYASFDMGGSFQGTQKLFSIVEPQVNRVLGVPEAQRAFLRFFESAIQEQWNLDHSGPFLEALVEQTGVGSKAAEYIATTQPLIAETLRPFTTVEFRITTAGGEDFSTAAATVEIDGEAPVGVEALFLSLGGREATPLPVTWVSTTQWRATVALAQGDNALRFVAVDRGGDLTASVEITVRREVSEGFVRGEANGDASVNIADVLAVLDVLFRGAEAPCLDAADVDDSGAVTIDDAIRLLDFLFRDGTPPPVPFPSAGTDPTPDKLGC